MSKDWKPPADWKVIETLEAHAAGEPLRLITKGLPDIPGDTILQKRRFFRDHYDYIRTGLMWEPRGHADMYGAVLTEPVSQGADFGVFFFIMKDTQPCAAMPSSPWQKWLWIRES